LPRLPCILALLCDRRKRISQFL